MASAFLQVLFLYPLSLKGSFFMPKTREVNIMADSFGLKIGVEGEKEFKKALSEINQNFKVLSKEIDEQKNKIDVLKQALDNASSSFGENDRSWCTSSASNDNRAITIEVASDTYHPYRVNDAAYKSLIKLLVDICKRNGIKELKWKADKSLIGQVDKQNMTVHRWFANKSCPGDYLYNLHGQIAKDVKSQKGAFNDLSNAKKCADQNKGYSVFDENGKAVYTPKTTNSTSSFKVQISISDLNIRKGPGTNYAATGKFTGKGVFTIVETKQGTGWGKLKSGAGWIALDYATRI